MDILFLEEDSCAADLLPFTSTRSVLDIRMGILTFREKWEMLWGEDMFKLVSGGAGAFLPANVLPTAELMAAIYDETIGEPFTPEAASRVLSQARIIRYPWDIFLYNAEAILADFSLITARRKTQPIPASVQAISPEGIFIEEGARLQHCLLNASAGPIYIGRNAEIMEGSLIRGPFAACEGATVKMGTKIYGATTLGPYSTAGGEIKNVVFFGYSNKGHDGYLGDSVIGEWCNLGAGTSASNLKNTASDVKVWHPASGRYSNAGLKCGLLMADYSRSAINTSFNTGTVVGVCCNVFGETIPPKYIPDFSWGAHHRYEWDNALRDIGNWKKLKNQFLNEGEINTLKHIFEPSQME
jgi:UDP-N-acetylglucosamine diphosphorylase/glucosamine-1-phosphate N-acetyltransferase